MKDPTKTASRRNRPRGYPMHENPCDPWSGTAKRYQDRAAAELTAAGREPSHYAWITTTCRTIQCIEPEHLKVHAPVRLAYPSLTCIYCGRPGHTRDHLLPRHWTGDARRHFVVTVPSCGTCNSVLYDTLTWSITERRAIAHVRLSRKFRKVLATKDHALSELDEYGPTLRAYIEDALDKKREVLRMLDWPEDPAYDARALGRSGIEDPWAIGLILPDDADLAEYVKGVA